MVPALRTCDSVCVLLFSSAWLCVFNLYLVFAIIAFSCNWHIECVCVCECVWNARARENNSRFVRWRAARAVGWVRAHARHAWERTHSRVSGERERFQFQSVATWIEPAFAIFVCIVSLRDCSLPRVKARARPHLSESVASEKENVWKIAVCRAIFGMILFLSVCVCLFALITNSFFLSFFFFFTRFVLNVRYFFCLI